MVGPDPSAPSLLLTLVFTDLEDSTGLKTRLGDQKAAQLIARHQELVHQALYSSSSTHETNVSTISLSGGRLRSEPTTKASDEAAKMTVTDITPLSRTL